MMNEEKTYNIKQEMTKPKPKPWQQSYLVSAFSFPNQSQTLETYNIMSNSYKTSPKENIIFLQQ